MKRLTLVYLLFFLINLLPCTLQADSKKVWILDIKGAIGPATADYFEQTLQRAAENGAMLVVLRIDTPGGLDVSMRKMIQAIIASPIPVVSYVSPSGARAASAGTYILYASHVAVMAPGTNLGAATPVQIGANDDDVAMSQVREKKNGKEDNPEGNTMTRKMVNDAEAYIRSLAQMRGRNEEWATKAVRESASLSAEDALKKGVIDFIANDFSDLLTKLNGREINVLGKSTKLSTQGLTLETHGPNWHNRLLSIITDPQIAYLLMLLGIWGLFFELANPGSILPGVLGGICLVLGLYALQVLPINHTGLALIFLGMAFIVGEIFVPSFGVLGIGGITSLAIGSFILLDSDVPEFVISRYLILGMTALTALLVFAILSLTFNVHRRPIVSGRESLIGAQGECVSNDERVRVHVQGEDWFATANVPIAIGQPITVTAINGLILTVEPVKTDLAIDSHPATH